jgi:hypothetical protein
MSTPTGSIVTGSNYLVDINFIPSISLNTIYLNSELSGSIIPNGGGSLTATSSLFISNRNSGSSVGSPLEIFNTKLYTPRLVAGMIRQNYNSLSTRLGLSQKISLPIIEERLLNLYPGAAAAYSLRSLNSDYDGAAIQVRRSSDNAVVNIGFTSNGDLDTIALLAHCGSSDGFVTEWFDQSGNGRNASQGTALYQPQIVSSGNVILENGGPSLKFNGTNNYLILTEITPNTDWSIFGIGARKASLAIMTFLGSSKGSINSTIAAGSVDNKAYLNNGTQYRVTNDTYTTTSQTLWTGIVLNSLPNSIYLNSLLQSSTAVNAGITQGFTHIGRYNNLYSNANLAEIILYQSDQLSNRSAIETNINSYYQIF